MAPHRMLRVVVVCMANVCRSPMAHAVIAGMAASRGLERRIAVQSAGVRVTQTGLKPDSRVEAALSRRGYALVGGRARALEAADFERFDLLLAMDRSNLADMQRMAPPEHRNKVMLFLDFAPGLHGEEVPDPYYGHPLGFERVLDLCEAGAHGLLETLDDLAARIPPR